MEERKALASHNAKQSSSKETNDAQPGFVAYFPEHGELYADIEKRFDRLCVEIQSAYDRLLIRFHNELENSKEQDEEKVFAAQAQAEQWKSLMFKMRKLNATAHDVLTYHTALKNTYQLLSNW